MISANKDDWNRRKGIEEQKVTKSLFEEFLHLVPGGITDIGGNAKV